MNANELQIGGRHYKTNYEHWDLAVAIPLGYLEGCATKYVSRWRKKGGISDLQKALHYLDKLIEVADYKTRRNLLPLEIRKEVTSFAGANYLNEIEGEFILLLCIYRNHVDLLAAHYTLEEIIENAEAEIVKCADEPNYPGTPEDGGHHAEEV